VRHLSAPAWPVTLADVQALVTGLADALDEAASVF
jgi:hypothetical protein